ncbi:MAG: hypothetical protein RQ741_02145 [Wenzhouxiangellaceae bacterium]|nr:hypothetical protein [Wenzhouxiangellaceae bacterium]
MDTTRWQMMGVLLWRSGLAFILAYAFYHGAWWFVGRLHWPAQLTVGGSIAVAGFGLLMLSLVLERRKAARSEGHLLDD